MASLKSSLAGRKRSEWDSTWNERNGLVVLDGDFMQRITQRLARKVMTAHDYAKQRLKSRAEMLGILEQVEEDEKKFVLELSDVEEEQEYRVELDSDFRIPAGFTVREGVYKICLSSSEMCLAAGTYQIEGTTVDLGDTLKYSGLNDRDLAKLLREMNPPPPPPPPAPKPVRRAAVKVDAASPTYCIPGSELGLPTVSAVPKFTSNNCDEMDLFALLAFHVPSLMAVSALIAKIGAFGRLSLGIYNAQGHGMLAATLTHEKPSVQLKQPVTLERGMYRLAWSATDSTECACWQLDREFRAMLNSCEGEIVLGAAHGLGMPSKLGELEPAHPERFPNAIPKIILKS